jgi:poly(hydroxyalkanoate) depolymerase family esterase
MPAGKRPIPYNKGIASAWTRKASLKTTRYILEERMKNKLIIGMALAVLMAVTASAHAGEWKRGKMGGFNDAWLYIPSSYAPRPEGAQKRSLVVHLIGCGQVIDQAKTTAGWEQAAEAYGMYVFIPKPMNPAHPNKQATKVECFDYGYDRSGNFGAAVPTPNSTDHKAAIAAPGLLRQQYSDIDPNQVYVAGLSAGGAMAMQVACMAPDVYRGVANAAGPGLNSRQAQAVSPVNGAGMASPQPTEASMKQQCQSWINGKTADFEKQIWAIVSDNNFLPVGNLTQVNGIWTFDMYNDGSIWDGDKFTPTEYHTRAVGMIKDLILKGSFEQESVTLLDSSQAAQGSGCTEAAADVTFNGATAGTSSDSTHVKCLPKDYIKRDWEAVADIYRASSGHVQLVRIQQDTLKHSWPSGIENLDGYLACEGPNGTSPITIDQIINPENPKYSVLKDPATGLWKMPAVEALANGGIGCIYFNPVAINFPMYMAELWNNNNPLLGAALGNNKVPELNNMDVVVSGYTLTVSGYAADSDGSISSVVATLVDQTNSKTYGPTNISLGANGSFTHTFTGLLDGRHRVTVVATDNESETTSYEAGAAVGDVPNNLPVVNTFSATSEEKGCISFSGTVSDSDGTVESVVITIAGQDSTVDATLSGGNFSAQVCELSMGRTYSGQAVAIDDLGGNSEAKTFSVEVPLSTDCESISGTVDELLVSHPDLIEVRDSWMGDTFYTTGDAVQLARWTGEEHTLFVGGDGKSYKTDPQDCAVVVVQHTVTATAGDNGSVTPATQQAVEGDTAVVMVIADDGYDIDTVEGCGGALSGNTYTTAAVTADCTVTASFKAQSVNPVEYTVTASASGNGTVTPPTQKVSENARATITVTASNGYKIKTVSGCGGTLNGTLFTTAPVTADCSVTATFEANEVVPDTFTVTATAGANGAVSPGMQTVEEGERATINVTADSGYIIKSVTGCGGALNGTTYTTAPVTANCSVSATFEAEAVNPVNYTVSATAGAGGAISPSGAQTVLEGSILTFMITPSANYTINSVSGCGGTWNGSGTYQTAAIGSDCTVAATFTEAGTGATYIVNARAGENGQINPVLRENVAEGSILNFTVTPDEGYEIDTVTGCNGSLLKNAETNNYVTGEITSSCTVVASFKEESTTTIKLPGGGAVNPVMLMVLVPFGFLLKMRRKNRV